MSRFCWLYSWSYWQTQLTKGKCIMVIREYMAWHKISKYSFTKLAVLLEPGKVGYIIVQCLIIYKPGLRRSSKRYKVQWETTFDLWGLSLTNAYTFASTTYMDFFNKHNACKHTHPEIKGIFKHKQGKIVSLGRLLTFFDGNC